MRENLENASRSGRPKLTDARTDRQLLRVVKLNHRKTLREATCVYNADTQKIVKINCEKTTEVLRLQTKGGKKENCDLESESYSAQGMVPFQTSYDCK